MKDEFLEKYCRKVSTLKSKPKKVLTVSEYEIERLNSSVEKKLKQNEKEKRASILDAEDKVVK